MASHPLADLLRVVDTDTRHDLEPALQPEVLRAVDVLFLQGDPAGLPGPGTVARREAATVGLP